MTQTPTWTTSGGSTAMVAVRARDRLGVPDTRREAVANAVLPRPRRSPRSRRPLGVGRSPSPPLLAEISPARMARLTVQTRPIAKTSGWCSRSHSPSARKLTTWTGRIGGFAHPPLTLTTLHRPGAVPLLAGSQAAASANRNLQLGRTVYPHRDGVYARTRSRRPPRRT